MLNTDSNLETWNLWIGSQGPKRLGYGATTPMMVLWLAKFSLKGGKTQHFLKKKNTSPTFRASRLERW